MGKQGKAARRIGGGPEIVDPFPQGCPMVERPELMREEGHARITATRRQMDQQVRKDIGDFELEIGPAIRVDGGGQQVGPRPMIGAAVQYAREGLGRWRRIHARAIDGRRCVRPHQLEIGMFNAPESGQRPGMDGGHMIAF